MKTTKGDVCAMRGAASGLARRKDEGITGDGFSCMYVSLSLLKSGERVCARAKGGNLFLLSETDVTEARRAWRRERY